MKATAQIIMCWMKLATEIREIAMTASIGMDSVAIYMTVIYQ